MIYHACSKRDYYPEERYEDDAETNVVQIVSRQYWLRHQKLCICRLSFQFYMILVAEVKITN